MKLKFLKGVILSALLVSCVVENDLEELSGVSESAISSKSVELEIDGVVSDTKNHEDNYVENTIDDDRRSRWSAYGSEVNLDIDLGGIHKLDYLKISFYKGDERVNKFKIFTLQDGTYVQVGHKKSNGSDTKLQLFDLSNSEAQFVRIQFLGTTSTEAENYGEVGYWNSILEIEAFGTILAQEVISAQNAFITDTSDLDTGELRLTLDESIAVGKMSVMVSKEVTQDGFINLSGTSTSRSSAMIDMRIDDENGYEFTESGVSVNAYADFPTFVNNELVEVVITWDATNITGPVVFVIIDGQAVTDSPFLSESSDLTAIADGVKTVQFRLGGNGSLDETGAGMVVDNLVVSDLSSGAEVVVFEDDFEEYSLGYSLDPNALGVAVVTDTPYHKNSFQVSVQPTGSSVDIVEIGIPADGYGAPNALVGEITWQNWYVSVPIDRADGSGKATSIYYSGIEADSLTAEKREYFDFNTDGSFKMSTAFTGYTTSGYYESFSSKYCRTELREYWQGNQSTLDNWYMDDAVHELESTLSVEKCEGEGKVYVAQIHGKSGISLSGAELTASPATVKVQWYEGNIILEYYTVDGVVDGEWTSASKTVGKVTVGEVGNNKFTVRLKVDAGKFYMALYCEATGVDTGYVEYIDYKNLGYEYQNYFKTGNYFRHDEDYTSVSNVTLYSAVTNHTNAE